MLATYGPLVRCRFGSGSRDPDPSRLRCWPGGPGTL